MAGFARRLRYAVGLGGYAVGLGAFGEDRRHPRSLVWGASPGAGGTLVTF